MLNSIQQFLKEGVAEIDATMDTFWRDPSKMAEMIYGVTAVVTGLGLSVISEEFEYADELLCQSSVRKEKWHIVRKDENTVLTSLGPVTYRRTLFKSKRDGHSEYLVDRIINITAHERMTEDAVAKVLEEAVETSYRKGGENACITSDIVSAETVMNKIRALSFPAAAVLEEKREAECIYIDCDEDHVSLQHTEEGGSRTAQPKMIYIYEGVKEDGKRRELVNSTYFGGLHEGSRSIGDLWEEVNEYIQASYDESKLRKIFINGDGAGWIKRGKDHIYGSEYVLDKFHMSKYITQATSHLYDSAEDAKDMIYDSIHRLDKRALKQTFEKILENTESEAKQNTVRDALRYLLGNWEGICAQVENRELLYGCSAEGHISHVYSDRMSSRPLGWSKKGVDSMARLRIYAKNGGNMLDLVRNQPLKKAAGAEEAGLTCGEILAEERRQNRNLGDLYGTKISTVPAMISKMLSIKEHIWGL